MASSPPAVPTAKTFQTAPIPSPDVSHDDIELTREVSRASGRKVAPQRLSDFELIRVLGKGCAGRVLLVKHAPTARVHAMKAISKRAVLANDELEHTLVEQRILHRFSKRERRSAFVSRLYYSFCDEENFYLVMEFYPGGDLATQMEIHGILGPLRTRFYACDIVAGLEAL
jgi:serine/threonine protein kinase